MNPYQQISKRTALVVDADPDINFLVSTHFECSGKWNVVSAHDGRSALAATRSARPDLAIIEMMLPGMSGPELARHIREICADVDVVLMTTAALAAAVTDAHWFERTGAIGVIAKPFRGRSLVDLVDRFILGTRRSRVSLTAMQASSVTIPPAAAAG